MTAPAPPRSRGPTLVSGLALLLVLCCSCALKAPVPVTAPVTVTGARNLKVAVIHYKPHLKETKRNLQELLDLSRQACEQGARLVVLPEMALSGYSFSSVAEVREVADTVPGEATKAFAQLAGEHQAYFILGLPQAVPSTGLLYNSAVLLQSSGKLETYHKRVPYMDSVWAATGDGPMEVFDTELGRLGILICADIHYFEYSRLAALNGAEMLVVLANGEFDDRLLSTRAMENGVPLLLANRHGEEESSEQREVFSQETFTIPTGPFRFSGASVIMDARGEILSRFDRQQNSVLYADLTLARSELPVQRRPALYGKIAQETTLKAGFLQASGLPEASSAKVVAFDPEDTDDPLAAVKAALQSEPGTQVLVLPGDFLKPDDGSVTSALGKIAQEYRADIVVGSSTAKAALDQSPCWGRTPPGTNIHRFTNSPRSTSPWATTWWCWTGPMVG